MKFYIQNFGKIMFLPIYVVVFLFQVYGITLLEIHNNITIIIFMIIVIMIFFVSVKYFYVKQRKAILLLFVIYVFIIYYFVIMIAINIHDQSYPDYLNNAEYGMSISDFKMIREMMHFFTMPYHLSLLLVMSIIFDYIKNKSVSNNV